MEKIEEALSHMKQAMDSLREHLNDHPEDEKLYCILATITADVALLKAVLK